MWYFQITYKDPFFWGNFFFIFVNCCVVPFLLSFLSVVDLKDNMDIESNNIYAFHKKEKKLDLSSDQIISHCTQDDHRIEAHWGSALALCVHNPSKLPSVVSLCHTCPLLEVLIILLSQCYMINESLSLWVVEPMSTRLTRSWLWEQFRRCSSVPKTHALQVQMSSSVGRAKLQHVSQPITNFVGFVRKAHHCHM